MANKNKVFLILFGAIISTFTLYAGNLGSLFAYDESDTSQTPVIQAMVESYESDLSTKKDVKRLEKLKKMKEKHGGHLSDLDPSIKDEVLDTTLQKIRKDRLKDSLPNKYKNSTQAVSTLVGSMKKDRKSSYRLYIRTSLTLEEIQSTLNYFDTSEITLSSTDGDLYIYEVLLPYRGKFARLIGKYLESGEVPSDLLPGIEIIKPTLVESIGDTTYLSGELTSLWGMTSIGADKYQKGLSLQPKVKVGVIDTGIFYTHPDLASNMYLNAGEVQANGVDDDGNGYIDDVYGYNFIDGNSNPLDDHNHGSHVAGVIGGVVNANGIYGVNSNASLIALKSLNANGAGSSYSIVEAINYAANNDIKIINMSLGGGGDPATNIICSAITSAKEKGVISIVSAGNSNADVSGFVPAGCSDAITVSAVDSSLTKAYFSNYGAGVDIAAPGVNIYSTVKNNSYATMNGTSMASPFVTGLVSAMKARNSTLDFDTIKNLLATHSLPTNSSVPIGNMISMTKVMDALGVPNDESLPVNNPPSVTLSKTKIAPNHYIIRAEATDGDGIIESIAFTKDGQPVTGSGNLLSIQITQNTTISVLVTDNQGATSTSSIELVYNASPIVDLVVEKTSVNNYLLTASGSDDVRIISYLFMVDGTPYQTSSRFLPLTITKDTTVSVRVTDEDGLTAEDSEELIYETVQNIPPSVSIESTQLSPNQYRLDANATDPDGTLASYEFSINGEVVSTGATYTLTISEDTSVRLEVWDNLGASAKDMIDLDYEEPQNTPPTLSLSGKLLSTNKYLVTANAKDIDGQIVSIAFYKSGALVGSGSTYTAVVTENTQILAVVTDNEGATAQASIDLIYTPTPNRLPTVRLSSIMTDINSYTITATGSDRDGYIVAYEYYNSGTLVGTGNVLTLNITQNTLLKCVVTDNRGGTGSKQVSLRYKNILPTVDLQASRTGFNQYAIVANPSDSDGSIVSVVLKQDGRTFSTQATGSVVLSRNSSISATVVDNLGGRATATISLSYEVPPKVGLSSIKTALNAYTLTANATAGSGKILRYEFYKENQLIGTGATLAVTITANSTIKVLVTDENGGSASASITLKYKNVPPSVSLTSTQLGLNQYLITANATDSDGSITKYLLRQDGRNISSTATGIVNLTKNSLITVLVTDNQGATGTNSLTLTYVLPPNVLPNVSLTPVSTSGKRGYVRIQASDSDGKIVNQKIYVNEKLVYSANLSTSSTSRNVSYTKGVSTVVRTVVTDNRGGITQDSITLQ